MMIKIIDRRRTVYDKIHCNSPSNYATLHQLKLPIDNFVSFVSFSFVSFSFVSFSFVS